MEPLFIGTYDLGQQNNLKPFMIPEKAFENLFNCYVFRGRVRRKPGYNKVGRLQRALPVFSIFQITTGVSFNILRQTAFVAGANNANPGVVTTVGPHSLTTGNQVIISGVVGAVGYNNTVFTITVITPTTFSIGTSAAGFGAYASGGFVYSNKPLSTFEPNAMLSPGTVTIVVNGTSLTDNGLGVFPLTAGVSGIINYFTGAVTLSGFASPSTTVTLTLTYFPTLPVMALPSKEQFNIDIEQAYAFDTRYSYFYNGTAWQELVPGEVWTGADFNFFWTLNYYDQGSVTLFWATNNADPIRYFDGSTWTDFTPQTDTSGSPNIMWSCLMLVPYKGRLVALNTLEGQTFAGAIQNRQRARWSINGDPTIQTTNWTDDDIGFGGYFDAPTGEAIVSCGFIKDVLIVYFERSTWQLFYTGNEILPFIWQRINSELGSDGTFSSAIFDNGLITFGNVGVHTSNGQVVQRIDQDIPDNIFDVNTQNQGFQRSQAVRDFFRELVYFSYVDISVEQPGVDLVYPNRVLCYDYVNKAYSFFDDRFTCFGYFQANSETPWTNLPYPSWDDWNTPWNSGAAQADALQVIGGNQVGYTLVMVPDVIENDASLPITAIVITPPSIINDLTSLQFTVPNHNLEIGQYFEVVNNVGVADLNKVTAQIATIVDSNNFTAEYLVPPTGTYIVGGEIETLPNVNITTKMFNPFWNVGQRYTLNKIKYLFDKTSDGAVSADIYVDTNDNLSMTSGSNPSNHADDGSQDPGTCLWGEDPSVVFTQAEPNIYNTVPSPPAPTKTPSFQAFQQQAWHTQYPFVQGDTFQISISMNDNQMRSTAQTNEIALHAMIMWFEPAGEIL